MKKSYIALVALLIIVVLPGCATVKHSTKKPSVEHRKEVHEARKAYREEIREARKDHRGDPDEYREDVREAREEYRDSTR